MKNIFIGIYIIMLIFFSNQLNGQLMFDEWGEIIPFSKSEKYKEIINTSDIHTLILPSYNNDSLCKAYNNGKSISEVGSVYAAGFPIDTIINVMKDGVFFEIDEGILWIYTIESHTAQALEARIKKIDIPTGAYLSFIGEDYVGHDPTVITCESIQSEYLRHPYLESYVIGHKITIEYFEPKNVEFNPEIIIYQIGYHFIGMHRKNINYKLKAGAHGTAKYAQCQYDVKCPVVQGWEDEAKAVGMISIQFKYNYTTYFSKGTCFFINKGYDYSEDEKPFIVTCGHLFNPLVDSVNHIFYDISQNYDRIIIYVEYINKTCNYINLVYGKTIGMVDLLKLGSSYNKDPLGPFYIESEDYSLLQTNKTVKGLGRYYISYAGWQCAPDYLEEGYAAIGHPNGDVKKVNIDYGYAYESSEHNRFGLYFDIGVSEPGFSGAPIFNSDRQIVGWLCTGEGDCGTVGSAHSSCGEWWIFHGLNYNYFDPELAYSQWWFIYEPGPIPSYCNNCVMDGDETNVDCGGSCYPCGMIDVAVLKSLQDIPPNNIVESRWSLLVDPDPTDQLVLASNNYIFKAGQDITIQKLFNVPLGASLVMNIDPILTEEPSRGCGTTCISVANNFSPNGDGINDFLIMSQTFITMYSLTIYDRLNHIKYSSNNNPVSRNGNLNIWDGSGGIISGEPYFGILNYKDCHGIVRNHDFFCYPYF